MMTAKIKCNRFRLYSSTFARKATKAHLSHTNRGRAFAQQKGFRTDL